MTLFRQVRCISRLNPWKIIVIFRRMARSSFWLRVAISCPFTSTEPSVGRSSMLIQRTSVLLPAPLMPMIPYTSPSRMVRLMWRRASTDPSVVSNCLDRFFSSIMPKPPSSRNALLL